MGPARLGTLLIAMGVMAACVGAPAALVSAQTPGSETEDGTVTVGEVTEPTASPPPAPSSPSSQTPAPAPSGDPDTPTPPPPGQDAGSDAATDVLAAQSTSAKTSSVSIQDGSSQSAYRFAPRSITVASGDTVIWTNDGTDPHDVTGDGLSSGTLSSGQDYSHKFNSPGSFNYICTIHPFMKGSVTVSGGGGGGSGGSGSGGGDPGLTGPGSESDAVSSAGAAGSDTQLPSTGQPITPLIAVGGALVLIGAFLRRRPQAG
jgi:LPXTG-motif cell wall-anchored protein